VKIQPNIKSLSAKTKDPVINSWM